MLSNGARIALNESQGHRTNQACCKLGIMSPEYHIASPRTQLAYLALSVFLTGASARSPRTSRLSKLLGGLLNLSTTEGGRIPSSGPSVSIG
jgi:hypothetical protein